ncbi:putative lipase Lih1p [[Candida] jaroonii]|uniref:Lipase Lih1p n=1 Tax=[Candida] jaroonii TaxID=467808 RepID=A0ACA9Y6K2_9ASCO|nr:putative lipase Lih1p [[Candida] jaroonii]
MTVNGGIVYDNLVNYAKLVSLSYCVKHGLTPGLLNSTAHCNLTRCNEEQLRHVEVLETFNFNDLGDIGGGYYAIDDRNSRIILAFRGTSSRRDWFANMDAIPTKYSPLKNLVEGFEKVECSKCKVHTGFYKFLRKNLSGILSSVKQLKTTYPQYNLVVLGHSLGASLALLSGIELQLMGYDPLVVTFAGPKLGNSHLCQFIETLFDPSSTLASLKLGQCPDKGYIRITHEGDIVPSLPPTNFFVHCGVNMHIAKKQFPHEPQDLKLYESPTSGLLKLLKSGIDRDDHSHYFIKITGCQD